MIGSVADASTCVVRLVLGLAVTLTPFFLVVMVALFMGPVFLSFF